MRLTLSKNSNKLDQYLTDDDYAVFKKEDCYVIKSYPSEHIQEFINDIDNTERIIKKIYARTDDIRHEREVFYTLSSINTNGYIVEDREYITAQQFYKENSYRGIYNPIKRKLVEKGYAPKEKKYLD